MNTQACMFEHDVVIAVKTGQWTDELRAHTETCPLCRETITVAAALHRVGQTTSGEAKTFAYHILWLRAKFMSKQERLSKLDYYMLVGLFGVVLLSLIGTVLWKWQLVRTWIMNGSSEPASNLPLYIVAGCVALVWFLTEEVLHEEQ